MAFTVCPAPPQSQRFGKAVLLLSKTGVPALKLKMTGLENKLQLRLQTLPPPFPHPTAQSHFYSKRSSFLSWDLQYFGRCRGVWPRDGNFTAGTRPLALRPQVAQSRVRSGHCGSASVVADSGFAPTWKSGLSPTLIFRTPPQCGATCTFQDVARGGAPRGPHPPAGQALGTRHPHSRRAPEQPGCLNDSGREQEEPPRALETSEGSRRRAALGKVPRPRGAEHVSGAA